MDINEILTGPYGVDATRDNVPLDDLLAASNLAGQIAHLIRRGDLDDAQVAEVYRVFSRSLHSADYEIVPTRAVDADAVVDVLDNLRKNLDAHIKNEPVE